MREGSLITRQMRDGIVTTGFNATIVAVAVVVTSNAVRCGSGAMRSLSAVTVATSRIACFSRTASGLSPPSPRSEEHTSELQSLAYLVCRLLLEKKKNNLYFFLILLKKKKKKKLLC